MKYRIAARFLRVCHFIQSPYLFYSNDIIIQSKTHFNISPATGLSHTMYLLTSRSKEKQFCMQEWLQPHVVRTWRMIWVFNAKKRRETCVLHGTIKEVKYYYLLFACWQNLHDTCIQHIFFGLLACHTPYFLLCKFKLFSHMTIILKYENSILCNQTIRSIAPELFKLHNAYGSVTLQCAPIYLFIFIAFALFTVRDQI